MNFSDVAVDALLLALYVVFVIVLILFGKYAGKTAYNLYGRVDPHAYVSRVPTELCTGPAGNQVCVPKTQEQINAETMAMAENIGRYVGTVIGFTIGGALIFLKAFELYIKLKGGKSLV